MLARAKLKAAEAAAAAAIKAEEAKVAAGLRLEQARGKAEEAKVAAGPRLEQARVKAEEAKVIAKAKATELDAKHDIGNRATAASARISASVTEAGDAAADKVAGGGSGGGGGGQQTRMAIVRDNFDPDDPNDMVPFEAIVPPLIPGYRPIGPIAVDAGWIVKVLNDAICGGDSDGGEWWHVMVPSTGDEGFIPASVALSTTDGGSGSWSSI